VTPADLSRPLPVVVEDGATFRENAEKKALAFARFSGRLSLADDSGLCVDALGGAPGVISARWSEDVAPGDLPRQARDQANNRKLLAALAGRPEAHRGAAYVAVLSLAWPDGRIEASLEGTCRGRIALAPRGEGGFGYDPLFIPCGGTQEAPPSPRDASAAPQPVAGRSPAPPPLAPGQPHPAVPALASETMAELPPEAKDALSHRGAAFRALRPVLARLATLDVPKGTG